jgi:hypothetical protein
MYDMLRTPLDYFLKCWIPGSQTYYVQVMLWIDYFRDIYTHFRGLL